MSALACGRCHAGLPPPDGSGTSVCVYCGTEHRDRTSARFAAALVDRSRQSQVDLSGDLELAARIPMTDDAVLHMLRGHFADADAVFLCPHVPPEKEAAARRTHEVHLPARERILALYDASWFGTATDDGFLVTTNRLCWKNPSQLPNSIEWRDLDPEEFYPDQHRLYLGSEMVYLPEDTLREACADAFHVLALSSLPAKVTASGCVPVPVRRTPASPPPPHTTSFAHYASHAQSNAPGYSCWHCHTPLWAETPQCSYCGAYPKTTGWLRTG